MNQRFKEDYERFTPHPYKFFPCIIRCIRNHELRYIYWGRRLQHAKTKIGKIVAGAVIHRYRRKFGLEMNFKKVGGYSPHSSMDDNCKCECCHWKECDAFQGRHNRHN